MYVNRIFLKKRNKIQGYAWIIYKMKYIHSFDVRGRAFNKALNWSDSTAVGPRAYFITVTKPAALSLEAVQLDDEGIYRCRVDFKNSPTKNFQVNLTVIGEETHYRNDRVTLLQYD